MGASIFLAGEDQLCITLGRALIAYSAPNAKITYEHPPAGGASKLLPQLPKLNEIAKNINPVVVMADGDQSDCVVAQIKTWMPPYASERFFLRLAVQEAESWLLADTRGAAEYFGVSEKSFPTHPESIDAKAALLSLVRKSAKRKIKEEMLPAKGVNAKTGLGYNVHVCGFVIQGWSAERAQEKAPSLLRAIRRLRVLEDD